MSDREPSDVDAAMAFRWRDGADPRPLAHVLAQVRAEGRAEAQAEIERLRAELAQAGGTEWDTPRDERSTFRESE
jgi:hypothetical protein